MASAAGGLPGVRAVGLNQLAVAPLPAARRPGRVRALISLGPLESGRPRFPEQCTRTTARARRVVARGDSGLPPAGAVPRFARTLKPESPLVPGRRDANGFPAWVRARREHDGMTRCVPRFLARRPGARCGAAARPWLRARWALMRSPLPARVARC